ncbi:MAG: ABC transporter permease [Myxococcota bacterium]
MRDLLISTWRTFSGYPARALLTLLGVVIGTGSIVMLAGLLEGAKAALKSTAQGITDSDTIRIHPEEPPPNQAARATRNLSEADGEALGSAPTIQGIPVLTEMSREARASRGTKEKRVRLVGGNERAKTMYRLQVEAGRFLSEEDRARGSRVAVVGHEVWQELLGGKDVLGEQLLIDGQSWTIVGLLAKKPAMGHGDGTWMWDRKVLVPDRSFAAAFDPTHQVQSVFLRAGGAGEARIAALGGIAEGILLRRHLGVKNFKREDDKGRQQERLIMTIIEVLLLGTGLMSLFVGGINIMNIMLVTVTERTKEIGLRRAIGASPRQILLQFLVESASISLVGGLIGVVLGLGVGWLGSWILSKLVGPFGFSVEGWAIAVGLGLSVLTGLVFGLVPAWRAAQRDPVEALRWE